jgi:GNAT superfamily N-acetyltransferase
VPPTGAAAPPCVRVATDDDVGALVALVQSAYRGDTSQQGWTSEADLVDGQRIDTAMMAEILADSDAVVLVAELGGAMVACCELRKLSDPGAVGIGLLSVDPARQATGLGRTMLAAAERHAVARFAATQTQLRVIDLRHELMAWYARRGYQPTGAYEPFPYDDERSGIPRRDDLRFAVLAKQLTDTTGPATGG